MFSPRTIHRPEGSNASPPPPQNLQTFVMKELDANNKCHSSGLSSDKTQSYDGPQPTSTTTAVLHRQNSGYGMVRCHKNVSIHNGCVIKFQYPYVPFFFPHTNISIGEYQIPVTTLILTSADVSARDSTSVHRHIHPTHITLCALLRFADCAPHAQFDMYNLALDSIQRMAE